MSRLPRAAKTRALNSRFNGAIETVSASRSFKSRAPADGPAFLDLAVETDAPIRSVKIVPVPLKPRRALTLSNLSGVVVTQTKTPVNTSPDPEISASTEIEPIAVPAPAQSPHEPQPRIRTTALSYLDMSETTYAKFCALRREMVGKIDSLQYKMDKESGKIDKYLFHTTFNETQFLTAIEAAERTQREKHKEKMGAK